MKDKPYTVEQEQIARFAKAMGHPARMAILAFLANQESCFFGDIHEVLLNSRRNRNAKSTILYQPGKLGTRTKVIYYFFGRLPM